MRALNSPTNVVQGFGGVNTINNRNVVFGGYLN
jgi:hypothetical protein